MDVTFKGPIEGFVINYLKRNYWRVSALWTYEDAFSEAQVLFYDLYNRYVTHGKVDNIKWFMTLYKKSFINLIHSQSVKDSTYRETIIPINTFVTSDSELAELESRLFGIEPSSEKSVTLKLLIEQAPNEIKTLVSVIAKAPAELLDSLTSTWKKRGKKIPFGNEMLCALIGVDPKKVNIIKLMKNYFQTA